MTLAGGPAGEKAACAPRERPILSCLARAARRIGRARDGATAVEFAFTFPVIAMLVIGILEFGMIQFVDILMESGLRDASRYGITGYVVPGITRMDRIKQIVAEHTLGLVDMTKADFQVLVYPGFDSIGGEEFVDANANGTYDAGETFTDTNSNGTWDSDIGVPGAGGTGQVVVYRIRYDWPLFTPFAATLIGVDGTFPIRASLAVRNEP